MSNKFLKVLGICILSILLPVLITVSVVCFSHDAKAGQYTVHSVYAEDVKLEEKDGVWKLSKVPTREYYSFVGVTVNGKTYAVEKGAVKLSKTEKEAFEKDVKANKPITSAWDCEYSYISICISGSLDHNFDNFQALFDQEKHDLEAFKIWDKHGFNASFDQYFIGSVVVAIDLNNSGIIDDDEEFDITFNAGDKTKDGDITAKTLLTKLAENSIELTPNASGYAELEIYWN